MACTDASVMLSGGGNLISYIVLCVVPIVNSGQRSEDLWQSVLGEQIIDNL